MRNRISRGSLKTAGGSASAALPSFDGVLYYGNLIHQSTPPRVYYNELPDLFPYSIRSDSISLIVNPSMSGCSSFSIVASITSRFLR